MQSAKLKCKVQTYKAKMKMEEGKIWVEGREIGLTIGAVCL